MNAPPENKNTYYRFLMIAFVVSSSLLTSCIGPKNLVTQQSRTLHYDYIGDTLDSWALVRKDSLWGYVSDDGKKLIKPAFLWATDFADGMALTQDKRGYRYLNRQGKLIRRIKAQHAYAFAEGLAAVEIKGKWGYINNNGKKVIKPQFDWAEPFREGLAAVAIGLKKGYINKVGELTIPAIYEEAHPFKNGGAVIRKDLKWGMIDTLGNLILPNKYDQIEPWETDYYRLGVYNPAVDRVNSFGLADASGKLLLHPVYDAIDPVKDQYIRVKKDTLTGLFDRQGKVVIPMEYTFLGFISEEGILAASKNGKWGFLNIDGSTAHPFIYKESKMGFREGRTWAYKDSTDILLDDQFRVIKKFTKYNKISPFSNGYATVAVKDSSDYYSSLYGFIDRNGNEVIAPQFDGGAGDINPYGIAVVGKKEYGIVREFLFDIKSKALVDGTKYSGLERFGRQLLFNSYGDFIAAKTGKPIADFPYENLIPLKYGERKNWAKVYRNGKIGLIDSTLVELLPPEYDDIRSIYNGRIEIKKNKYWGYADEQFRIRIPFIYNDVEDFRHPMLTKVVKDKKKGGINRYGQVVIPLNYNQITFDFACDRVYAEYNDGIDIYDREGRLLLATDFGYIGQYGRNNYISYRQDGKLGFMDYNFKVLYAPEFDGYGLFYEGLAWVAVNGKGGYINKEFQLIIPIQFESIESFAHGLAKVKKDGREYYINTKGEEVIPTEAQLEEREKEIERRKQGWFEFSS